MKFFDKIFIMCKIYLRLIQSLSNSVSFKMFAKKLNVRYVKDCTLYRCVSCQSVQSANKLGCLFCQADQVKLVVLRL
jgi:hypothetical protein